MALRGESFLCTLPLLLCNGERMRRWFLSSTSSSSSSMFSSSSSSVSRPILAVGGTGGDRLPLLSDLAPAVLKPVFKAIFVPLTLLETGLLPPPATAALIGSYLGKPGADVCKEDEDEPVL